MLTIIIAASSEQFPNLPVQNLKDNEIEHLRARLIEDYIKLDRDFTSLVHKTLEFLEKANKSVEELRDLIKTSSYYKPLLDLFRKAESLRDLFVEQLDGYWSFFDYDLVEIFIQHFGNKDLNDLMDKYLTAFNQYCQRRLSEVPTIMTRSGEKGYNLHVKLPHKMDETSANEIKKFQGDLQNCFGTKLYVKEAQDGCIILVFVSLIEIVFLTREQEHQLHSMGVLQVSTDRGIIYPIDSKESTASSLTKGHVMKDLEKLKSIPVMVPEPPKRKVKDGKIQPFQLKGTWSHLKYWRWQEKWCKAELYLTPTSLCYEIEGIGVS